MTTRNPTIPFALAALLGALAGAPAGALTIELTNITLALNAGNDADAGGADGNTTIINLADGGGSNPFGDTGTIDAGGIDLDAQIGDFVTGSTRYAGSVWRSSNTAGTLTYASDYRLSFDVIADAGVTYDITLSHDLEGVLECTSSVLGCAVGRATVSNVLATAVNDGGGTVSGDLTQATAAATTTEEEIDITVDPAVITISGLTGTQSLVLDFSWTSSATSSSVDCGLLCTDNEEASVRFGLQPDNGPTYGTPGASGPGDGHFVGITATVAAVPEPSTGLLLGLGMTALVCGQRLRRGGSGTE